MTALPITTGPVNLASGAFHEDVLDLGFGPSLPWLQLRRAYNSSDTVVGPFGPGWSSWASARLGVVGTQRSMVHWRGPDAVIATVRIGEALPGGDAYVVGAPPELVFPQAGMQWRFDPQGRPLFLDPGPGDRVGLVWDDDRLVAMRHERGRGLVLAWQDDRIVTAEADDGRWVAYGYDDRGRLITVEGPAGLQRYEWGADDRITAVVDADGIVTAHAAGHVGALAKPGPADEASREWDDQHRVVAVTTPAGTTRLGYTGRLRVPSRVEDPEGGVTHLDAGLDGLVRRVTDPDGVGVGLTHDAQGRLTVVTDARGHARRYEWTADGRLAAETSPLGHRTTYERDAAGRVTTRTTSDGSVERTTYSAAGRVLAVVDAEGGITRWSYGPDGWPVEETGPEGDVTTRTWDADGLVTAEHTPTGHTWSYSYDADQRLVGITDPLDGTWHHHHDTAGRPAGLSTPTGRRLALTLDPDGRLLAHVATGPGLPQDVLFGYDPAGRMVAFERADGTGSEAVHDRCGRLTSITAPGGGTTQFAYSLGGRLTTIVDPLGAVTRLGYDACGRLVETTDPCGGRTRWRYDPDGQVIQVTNPTGERTRYAYDAGGRVVEETAPHGGITRYGYDRVGRLTTVTDASGAVVRWSYDLAGRVVATVDANGGIVTFAYDGDGNLVTRTDPLGATTSYSYDGLERLVATTDANGHTTRHSEDEPAGAGREVDIDASRTTTRDACRRVVALDDLELGPVRITCDLAGRPIGVEARELVETLLWCDGLLIARERVASGVKQTIRYSRDVVGRVVETVDDGGRRTRFGYDPAGQLTSVELPDRMWRFGWDACGRLAREDAPTGRRRYSYDLAGRLTGVATPTRLTRLTWDDCGRRLTEATAGAIRRFDWDDTTGQLTTVRSIGDPEQPETTVHLRYDEPPSALHDAIGQPDLDLVGDDPFGPTVDGLLLVGDRVYDPVTRSLLSPAPSPTPEGHPASSNLYSYAANDPVNQIPRPHATPAEVFDGEADWQLTAVAALTTRDEPTPWQAYVYEPVDLATGILTRALRGEDPFDTQAIIDDLAKLPTPTPPAPAPVIPSPRRPWATGGGWPGAGA